MTTRGTTRRSFLQTALAGGAFGTAYLAIGSNMMARAAGPITIGHQAELTGGFSSWGYWHDKAAQKAAAMINEGGGIAGRELNLVTEDTESNPATGARKLRSLIQRNQAAFITGSVHSGVMLASIPVATEMKTVYFSCGEATEATGEKGSRYAFRTGNDTYTLSGSGAPWAYENLGKNWTMIFPDYAWGHSHHQEHKRVIEGLGGTVNDPIAVPLDARDLVPYLAKIPEETEVLFSVFFGALSVAFYTQAKSMGLGDKMKMYSVAGTIEAISPEDIDGAAEGVYFLENFPRPLAAKDDEPHATFNKIMEIDDVDARERDSDRVMAKSHAWQPWENLFLLKAAIEASGWQDKSDDQGVIEYLEGAKMENSLQHAQGEKLLRAEDHSGILDNYISQVQGGKFEVIKRIPKEEIAENLPPRYDFTKEAL
ncbi:ABC transporter substrate-binding protein [Acuticoccus sp. I52.16.1]|uniref:ABC transporter substrate-binding protein n=1 Tax=Acuticoccus sp. I52.16.1 TaxID=2928472 RepID=UPI001FD01A0C|nr:ABC transporter substrate-binding protein [Acuticoccus sp. I52.16.1]UOM35728.1 ABC transporter substrate-binding protein [Acuticoccus sp. I52.16.1]